MNIGSIIKFYDIITIIAGARNALVSNELVLFNVLMFWKGVNYLSKTHYCISIIKVVATTPEKTHNQKFLTFETIFNRFFVQF